MASGGIAKAANKAVLKALPLRCSHPGPWSLAVTGKDSGRSAFTHKKTKL